MNNNNNIKYIYVITIILSMQIKHKHKKSFDSGLNQEDLYKIKDKIFFRKCENIDWKLKIPEKIKRF